MEVVTARRLEAVVPQEKEELEVEEAGLQGKPPQIHHHQITITTHTTTNIGSAAVNIMNGEYEEGESSRKSVYLDSNGGNAVKWSVSETNPGVPEDEDALNNLDIQKALNDAISAQHEEIDLVEESDEEVIELEFERAITKLNTHTMHCPNCNSHITKVILRRKRVNKITPPSVNKQDEPVDLLGCLSCFSLFIPTGNGFNCFNIFGNKREKQSTQVSKQEPVSNEDVPATNQNSSASTREHGDCFSLFRIFGNKSKDTSTEDPPQISAVDTNSPSLVPTYVTGNKVIAEDNACAGEGHRQQHTKDKDVDSSHSLNDALPGQNGHAPRLDGQTVSDDGVISGHLPTKPHKDGKLSGVHPQQGPIQPSPDPDVRVDVLDEPGYHTGPLEEEGPLLGHQRIPSEQPTIQSGSGGSKSLEILKSIVYGGLMESIASLSVVSSAAASDATTLNVIALALANLIGGLFIIGHNLWDLKDDCQGGETNETNQAARKKYRELLGRIENFPLHVTFSVLSFLVFGLIPPLTYGFSFRKSNDKDLKIIAVAAASLLCIILLAIGMACIKKTPKFYAYIKTVLYYVTTAVLVSGVSYAAGNLIRKYVEKLGLFDTSSAVTLSLSDINSRNPALAFY